jgi:hypothetical protein
MCQDKIQYFDESRYPHKLLKPVHDGLSKSLMILSHMPSDVNA